MLKLVAIINIRNRSTHTELTLRKTLTRFTLKRMLIMVKIILTIRNTLFTTVDIEIIETHILIIMRMSILQTLMTVAIESTELAQ